MRLIHLAVTSICLATVVHAHHPDRENHPVHPRIDVIPPLGNRLPISYRRRYNRPRYIGGKISYLIAPTSQEAMAWHAAAHRGDYINHRPRIEMHYFYPKPWEALTIGPRPGRSPEAAGENGDADDYPLDPDASILETGEALDEAISRDAVEAREGGVLELIPVEPPDLPTADPVEP